MGDSDNKGQATMEPPPKSRAKIMNEAAARQGKVAASTGGAKPTGSFFSPFKPNQGKVVRWGTAVGVGLLGVAGANFLADRLSVYGDTMWIQRGIPVLFLAALALLVYWLVGRHQRIVDFMIATEGEMKKVNWSTRQEVLGATKVVIFFVLAIAAILFIVDIFFIEFFHGIGVLKIGIISRILESFGEGS